MRTLEGAAANEERPIGTHLLGDCLELIVGEAVRCDIKEVGL